MTIPYLRIEQLFDIIKISKRMFYKVRNSGRVPLAGNIHLVGYSPYLYILATEHMFYIL